jgi:thioredoxin-related protein
VNGSVDRVSTKAGHEGLSRRRVLQAIGLTGLAMGTAALASERSLPLSDSLQYDLTEALKKKQPLVVMVSLEGCPFCKVARRNYLAPMHEEQSLHVTQVDMRSNRPVLDFNGQRLTHDAMVRAWNIRIAPTLLFFGRGGVEVAERMVGGYIPDFYGAYLDQRLLQARAAVR